MTMPNFSKEQRALLRELRFNGRLSRASLAHRLELSPTAMTSLSRQLLNLDVIEEHPDSVEQRRGRPAVPLSLSPKGGYSIGATAHKGMLDIAMVDFVGNLITAHREEVPPLTPVEFARKLRRITHQLVETSGLLGRRMLGLGIAVPGPSFDTSGERWSVVEAMPGWRGAPLKDIFDSELGWPIWLENDANAAAIAELYCGGHGADCNTMAVILLGYGIGAGVISRGDLFRGNHGIAGEIGALFPSDKPRPSPLDLLNTLQAAGCTVQSLSEIDPRNTDQAPIIEGWMDRAAKQLKIVCNTAFAWFDPGVIVLAGTLPQPIFEGLEQRLKASRLATTIENRKPPITISGLSGSPVTLGAALMPIHALGG